MCAEISRNTATTTETRNVAAAQTKTPPGAEPEAVFRLLIIERGDPQRAIATRG